MRLSFLHEPKCPGWYQDVSETNFCSCTKYELSLKQIKDLMKFFESNGYISHEFHEPIHELIKELNIFIKDNE